MSNITHFPQRAPPEDPGAFTEDQVETLGHALAGLRDEIQGASNGSLATALGAIRNELEAGFERRLVTAVMAAREEFRTELAQQLDAARAEARQDLRAEFREWLERAVKALREESELNLAAVRAEILGKIDQKTYGLMLTDIDPRALERGLGQLRVETAERLQATAARLDGVASGLAELEPLRQQVKTLRALVSVNQRAAERRVDAMAAKSWKTDAEKFCIAVEYAGGSAGPACDLMPLFQRFHDATRSR